MLWEEVQESLIVVICHYDVGGDELSCQEIFLVEKENQRLNGFLSDFDSRIHIKNTIQKEFKLYRLMILWQQVSSKHGLSSASLVILSALYVLSDLYSLFLVQLFEEGFSKIKAAAKIPSKFFSIE